MVTKQRWSAGRLILIAWCLALIIAGCGDGGRASSETPREGVVGDLPCAFSASATWAFEVAEGQQVEIALDATSAATASELGFGGSCGALTFHGHDERPCSFPPPFGCPATSFTATSTAQCWVTVFLDTYPPVCPDAASAEYVLEIRIDDTPASPTLVDQYPPSPLPRPILTDAEDVTPCGAGAVDTWRFDILAGETVAVAVQAADRETTAELALNLVCGGGAFPSLFLVPCEFPPASGFGCPLATFEAPADAACLLSVGDFGVCADPGTARYRLGVERDGAPAAVTLTTDDFGPPSSLTPTTLEDVAPCGAGTRDLWQFPVVAGETVVVAVDTADQETAANLSLDVHCDGSELLSFSAAPCSFPAPEGYWCPRVALLVAADTTCTLAVGDFGGCADPASARYRLDVERDGMSAALTLTADDFGAFTLPAFTDAEDVTPCDGGLADSWQFDVRAGETVAVAADTVDQKTAADLALTVLCDDQVVLSADDNRPCTFPPPAFACPAGSFIPPADAACTVIVQSLGSCSDASLARYRVGVERDGVSAALTLTGDDEPPGFAP